MAGFLTSQARPKSGAASHFKLEPDQAIFALADLSHKKISARRTKYGITS